MSSTLSKPELTTHPVDVGHRTEAAVIYRLIESGYRVLLPAGVNQRYDLVIEEDGRFLTAQCKTGRLRDGVVIFPARSIQSSRSKTSFRSYKGQVDLFIVHCPENKKTYAIPCEEVPDSHMYLRLDPPRNGQRKRVRWARDYELPA